MTTDVERGEKVREQMDRADKAAQKGQPRVSYTKERWCIYADSIHECYIIGTAIHSPDEIAVVAICGECVPVWYADVFVDRDAAKLEMGTRKAARA